MTMSMTIDGARESREAGTRSAVFADTSLSRAGTIV
jgi:hypothetical protein